MPTIRQKIAASKLVENGGNMGKAMIAAGYSPATAKTPQKLTGSKGWKELMDNAFPDILLAKAHRDLLRAKKIIIDRKTKKVIGEQPNWLVVGRALDMAYRVRGLYPSNKKTVYIRDSRFDYLSGDDLEKLAFAPYKLDENGKVVPLDKSSEEYKSYAENCKKFSKDWQEAITYSNNSSL